MVDEDWYRPKCDSARPLAEVTSVADMIDKKFVCQYDYQYVHKVLEIRERLFDIRGMSVRDDKPRRLKLRLHHRPVAIERKFLVANDEWRQFTVGSVKLRDGLIAVYKDRKVRVRIAGNEVATVAIKGERIGIAQSEFEYEIPIADAETMLTTICRADTLEKERFFVENASGTWHVDVYSGILQGVVIAEIELKDESQELILPPWIGKEVTGDPSFKKITMRAHALNARESKHKKDS